METNPKLSFLDFIKEIWFFIDNDKKKYLFFNILLFILYFYQLVPIYIVGLIVDFFVNYNTGDSLKLFYIYLLIIGVSYVFVSITRLTAKKNLGDIEARVQYNIKVWGFERLMHFSLVWHDKENSGNKVQRIIEGSNGARRWINTSYEGIYPKLSIFIGVMLVFLFLDIIYFFFFFIYLAIFFSILYFFNKKITILYREIKEAKEITSGNYFEGTSNILSIKALGIEDSLVGNIKKYENRVKELEYQVINLGNTKWKFFQTLNGISLMLFLLIIGYGVVNDILTVGMILVYYTYFNQLINAAGGVSNLIDTIISQKTSVERMMPIFNNLQINKANTQIINYRWKTIKLEDLTFHYKDKKVFNKLNLSINKNKKIGLVGRSGSGKSTLLKILMGLYKIDSGNIKIGNNNFYDLTPKSITDNFSIILQDTELFNMTLHDNLTMLKNIPHKQLELAVKISKLDSVIKKLPQGINTIIGEKGYRLSGGERQRIGIARAIIKNSPIMIFDEATSSLDSKTEKQIMNNIYKYLPKKTILFVAHRLSTIKNVDTILLLEKGKITESGTFDKLYKNKNSKFRKLWDLQNKK